MLNFPIREILESKITIASERTATTTKKCLHVTKLFRGTTNVQYNDVQTGLKCGAGRRQFPSR